MKLTACALWALDPIVEEEEFGYEGSGEENKNSCCHRRRNLFIKRTRKFIRSQNNDDYSPGRIM